MPVKQGSSKSIERSTRRAAKGGHRAAHLTVVTPVRREKKRGQGIDRITQGNTLFDQMYADRRRQAVDSQHERELERYEFRVSQALKAREHEWFTALRPGTISYRLANAALEAFPLADSTDKSKKRTDVALEEALQGLSDEDVMRQGAIKHGASVVRVALKWAYDQLPRDPRAA